MIDFPDDGGDRPDRGAAGLRFGLDGGDAFGEVFGRGGRLTGQRLDLVNDHGEVLVSFTCRSSFDGRIQDRQIGLFGDCGDGLDDFADLIGTGGQSTDRLAYVIGRVHSFTRDPRGLAHLAGDLVDKPQKRTSPLVERAK